MDAVLQDAKGRFVTGTKGGPGRPVGSRNALSEAFLSAYYEDFRIYGPEVISTVRRDDPVAYLKIGALQVAKDPEARAEGVTVVNVITGVPR